MIPNFKEFIEESLWSKGLERAQTGEIRQENKLVSNINEFNEVDLSSKIPFVFADKDLIINGDNEYFTWRDMMTIIDNIKNTGWRLPTMDDFKQYFMTDYKTPKKNVRFNMDKHLTEISIWFKSMFKSDDKKPKLIFNINPNHNKEGEDYWLGTSPMDDISDKFDKVCFSVGDLDYKDMTPFIIFGKNPTKQCKIRLVKDKNKMNEGLWSKGLERAQTGELRKENLIDEIFNIFKLWHKGEKLNFNFRYENLDHKEKGTFTREEWTNLINTIYEKLSKNNLCEDITDLLNSKYNKTQGIIDIVEDGYCVVYTNEKRNNLDLCGKIDDSEHIYITIRHWRDYDNDITAATSKYTPKDVLKYNKMGQFMKVYKIPNDVYVLIYKENKFTY